MVVLSWMLSCVHHHFWGAGFDSEPGTLCLTPGCGSL